MTTALRQPVCVNAANVKTRLVAGVVCVACFALLALAGSLTPSADGHGTHTQMGLPQCSIMAFTDVPCPSCGMTTSFAHAADGRMDLALLAQPAGAMLALATAMAVLIAGYIAVTGHNVAVFLRPLLGGRGLVALLGLVVGAWVYKIVTLI